MLRLFESKTLNIDAVIKCAMNTFIPGTEKNKAIKKQLMKNLSFINPTTTESSFPQFKDAAFTYNANSLKNSNFIAMKGPQTKEEVEEFIANTVYNKNINIRHVVALGTAVGYQPERDIIHQDFHDYCLKPRTTMFGKYQVEIRHVSGSLDEKHRLPLTEIVSPLIRSQLVIVDKENKASVSETILDVTIIKLMDNFSINLTSDKDDVLKELFWQLSQKPATENMGVHCTSGVGRTGHIILMIEILKHYDQIFSSHNPIIIAQNIHQLLEQLRETRPALVLQERQFADAIRNAYLIHEYALKKAYIFSDPSEKNQEFILHTPACIRVC